MSQLSQHLEQPGIPHWIAFKHVLRYLAGSKDLSLTYSQLDSSLHPQGHFSWSNPTGFADADWAGCPSTRRSTTGYLFLLNGGAISWQSRKQPTVALSSSEAEYRSCTTAGQEAIWLKHLFESINIPISCPLTLYGDNQGAIALSQNPIFQARTKHIEVQYHWIREQVLLGNIEIPYTPTSSMLADCLTKSTPGKTLTTFLNSCGLLLPKSQDRRVLELTQ